MKKINLFILTINLYPKLIVTALVKGLSRAKFLLKVRSISQNLHDHSALVPSLDPNEGDFKLEVDALQTLMVAGDSLVAALKANTAATSKQRDKITGIMTDKYCNQIQNTPNITLENVKALGFGVKGVDDQQADDIALVSNSHPTIEELDNTRYLEIMLTIHNSKSGKIGLPEDGKRCDIFMKVGGDKPLDLKGMTYVGSSTRGHFHVHFTSDQLDQDVWFIAVYVAKASSDGEPELSPAVKGKIQ